MTELSHSPAIRGFEPMPSSEEAPAANTNASQRAPVNERRAEDRVTTVYRPVIIEVSDFTGFCLVRNISPTGLQGVVYADFGAHQPITIEFGPNCRIDGTIVWSREKRIGVQFDSEIDVVDVLHNLGKRMSNDLALRAPRLPITCQVRLECEGQSFTTLMHDISQRGLKVSCTRPMPNPVGRNAPGPAPRRGVGAGARGRPGIPAPPPPQAEAEHRPDAPNPALKPGDEVFVHLNGLESRLAIVRWVHDGQCGLNFTRPFDLDLLADWVVRNQTVPLPVGGPAPRLPL